MFKRQPPPQVPVTAHDLQGLDDQTPALPVHDESNWLISYADMMTLLCGFFIMLFSMCRLDDPQYDSFKEALSKQFGGEYVSATKELARFATQILQELGMEKTVTVKSDSTGISLVFQSRVFFDTLSAEVSPEGRQVLLRVIDALWNRQNATQKSYRVIVEGHTDSRPITGGVYPSNWELSGARAARVVRLFLDRGFPAERLTAIGYADTHPKLEARTQDGRWNEGALAVNRRVVIRILEPQIENLPLPDSVRNSAEAPSTGLSTQAIQANSAASATTLAPSTAAPAANTAH